MVLVRGLIIFWVVLLYIVFGFVMGYFCILGFSYNIVLVIVKLYERILVKVVKYVLKRNFEIFL